MSKHNHATFGSLGQHEFYLPTTGKGHANRRDRKRCEFYCKDTKYCSKIHNTCVGPTVCHKYAEQRNISRPRSKNPTVGTIVYNEHRGTGRIVTISKDICTIQFPSGKKITAKFPDVFYDGTFKIVAR